MAEDILLTPGPTPLPPQVREALARPIIHHRTSRYRGLFKHIQQDLRAAFQTAQPVLVLTSSGTGAMEASVANLLSPGDEAIVVLGGKFSERWQQLCQAYGIQVATIPVAYGEAVEPQRVAQVLAAHPKAKAVFATLCETSTGVVHDIQKIAAITRRSPTVLVVDAISGLLADDCPMDAWGVDVVVSGSQKGLMLPPGLAFICLSERAWTLVDASKSPRFYYDLRLYRKSMADDDTPFTSAVALVIALGEALERVREEGLPEMFERCARMAQATRAGATALGLTPFAKRPSNGVTSICVPEGIDGKKLTKLMYERSRVMVAGGQGEMEGTIFRFAHMGFIQPDDVLAGLAALEQALADLGRPNTAGVAVRAAKQALGQSAAVLAK